MKKSTTLLFILMALYSQMQAQGFDWAERAGKDRMDQPSRVIKGSDGYFRMVGKTGNGAVFGNLNTPNTGFTSMPYVACFDGQGHFRWANIGTQGLGGEAMDVTTDSLGNTYITGSYTSGLSFDTCHTSCSAGLFVAKFDTGGHCKWIKWSTSSLTSCYNAKGLSIKADTDGNVILVASASTYGNLILDTLQVPDLSPRPGVTMLVSKITPEGKFIWGKLYHMNVFVSSTPPIPQNGTKLFYDQGHWCFTARATAGDTVGTIVIPTTGGYIFHLDNSGNVTQAVNFSTNGIIMPDLDGDQNGHVYVTGFYIGPGNTVGGVTFPTPAYSNGFIAKLSTTSGTAVWTKYFGSSVYAGGAGVCIAVNKDRIFLSGGANDGTVFDGDTFNTHVGATLFVSELDTAGHYHYEYPILGNSGNYFSALAFDSDTSCVLAGYSNLPMYCGNDSINGSYSVAARFAGNSRTPSAIYEPQRNTDHYSIYPNPAKDILYVMAADPNVQAAVNIYDLSGRLLISHATSGFETAISVEGLLPGMYLAEINSGGSSKTFKWIKQ